MTYELLEDLASELGSELTLLENRVARKEIEAMVEHAGEIYPHDLTVRLIETVQKVEHIRGKLEGLQLAMTMVNERLEKPPGDDE